MRIRNPETGTSWRPEDFFEQLSWKVGDEEITEQEFLESILLVFPGFGNMWYVDTCEQWLDWAPSPELLKECRKKIEGAVYRSDMQT